VDDDALAAAIERARRLAEPHPEPFRSLAFTAVLERLLRAADEEPGAHPGARSSQPRAAAEIPADIAEFLAGKKVTTHPDRVVAIAYHTFHTTGGAGVTTADLGDAYSRARVRKPQNFPDVIATCVRKGRLVEGERRDAMKTWVITRTGEEFVEKQI
jgi:hypothetical protein